MIARAEFDGPDAKSLIARLKREAERSSRDRDRAQGSLDRVMEDIKRSFGVGSLEEAVELLKRLEAEAEAAEGVVREGVRRYEKRYGRKLQ